MSRNRNEESSPGPVAPAGFRLAALAEVLTGAALIGRAVLYRWPAEGWVRGKAVRRTLAAGFAHVAHRPGAQRAARRRSGRRRRPSGFSTGPRTARPGVGCSSSVCVSLGSQ